MIEWNNWVDLTWQCIFLWQLRWYIARASFCRWNFNKHCFQLMTHALMGVELRHTILKCSCSNYQDMFLTCKPVVWVLVAFETSPSRCRDWCRMKVVHMSVWFAWLTCMMPIRNFHSYWTFHQMKHDFHIVVPSPTARSGVRGYLPRRASRHFTRVVTRVKNSVYLSPHPPREARCEGTNLDVRGVLLHAWWLVRKVFALCICSYIYIYIYIYI